MKIGISGYVGTGKSELADALRAERGVTYLIDGYVSKLEDKINVSFGHYATHLGNVQIAIERYNAELESFNDGGDSQLYITVGTLLDTLAYSALYAQRDINDSAESARVQATMEFLGMMYIDTFDYDHVFILGPSENSEYDYHVGYANRLFNSNAVFLEGSHDERVAQARKVISEAHEAATTD